MRQLNLNAHLWIVDFSHIVTGNQAFVDIRRNLIEPMSKETAFSQSCQSI